MDDADLRSLNTAAKEYLQAIYELEEENRRILRARIAERLGIAPATVTEGVRRLAGDGLVALKGRTISLTRRGRDIAEVVVRRHRLAERMLVDLLGIPWHACHEQAEDWEKVITDEVENALLNKLRGEPLCPHGNPIPGVEASISWAELVPLSHLKPGDVGTLVRLLEDVELNHEVLKYLQSGGLVPPCRVQLVSVAPDATRTIGVSDRLVGIAPYLADNLWILPGSPAA
jgi:DtxR family transcriptional regulator, Mn-dependent transcriptional regulator